MNSRMDEIESTRRPQNTCIWLLTDENYQKCLSDNRIFLWIRGHPGTGKSVLTHYAYRKSMEDRETSSPDLIIAAFFCHDRGEPLQKTPLGLFRTLLYQLLPQIPDLLVEFVKYYEKRKQSTTEQRWEWSKEELEIFFLNELTKTPRQYEIRIFVDALDEFGTDAALSLMDYFHDLLERSSLNETRIKICFSCRHFPLTGRFNSALTIEVENENRMDIQTYIEEKTRPYLSDSTGAEEVKKINKLKTLILEKAQGVFLWVHLALQVVTHFSDRSESELYEEMEKLPKKLGDLYKNIFLRSDPQDRPKTLLLLQWVCFAVRPLAAPELRFAILLDEDVKSIQKCKESKYFRTQDTELRNLVKRLSCGLLEITNDQSDNQSVQFIHQSVKDYLIQERGLQSLDPNLVYGSGDYILSRLCIRYLAMKEIVQLNYAEFPNIESEFPLLSYATTSWTMHSERAEALHISQVDLFSSMSCSEQKFMKQWVYIYQRIKEYDIECPVQGTTLLHILCRYGLLSLLSVCVDNSDTDAKDNAGQTPLSWAAKNGHEAVVRLLLKKAVDVESKDEDSRTALSWAVGNGHAAVVKLLLEKAVDVDSKDTYSRTTLWWAAENGDEAVVKLLLEKAVDVDSKNTYGRTALSRTAGNGDAAVVKLLLEKAVDLDSKDTYGRTALSWAAENGHEAVVKLLLEKAVDVDSKDTYGRTALWWAAGNRDKAVVKLLLEKAVDLDSKDTYGQTALSRAAENRDAAVVKLLLEKAVDLDSKDTYGRTALSRAAENGHEAVVKLLLEKAVDVDSKDEDGRTALSRTAENGGAAVVKLLLEKAVDVDSKDEDSRTALWWAARNGHEAVVKLLLEKAVDVDSKDEDGQTALWWAVRNGHEAVVKLLKLKTL